MKNKGKTVSAIMLRSIIILTLITAVSVAISTSINASQVDEYYFTQLSNMYEQQLTTTINSMIQTKFELDKTDDGNLDSLDHLMRECQTNLRLTALMSKNFEMVLNRDNGDLMVSMTPIVSQYEKYSDLILNQSNNGYNELEFKNILQDVRTIKKMLLFSENERSYEDIKQKWNLESEKLIYKPEFNF